MSTVTKPIILDETGVRIAAALETIAAGGEHELPSGGTTGQVLTKKTGTDYDVEWTDQSAGTVDYTDLTNKPSINNVPLSGNKTSADLGIPSTSDLPALVGAWLDENITNPDSPPLDRTLSSSSAAAPADMLGEVKSATESIPYITMITIPESGLTAGYGMTDSGATVANSNLCVCNDFIAIPDDVTIVAFLNHKFDTFQNNAAWCTYSEAAANKKVAYGKYPVCYRQNTEKYIKMSFDKRENAVSNGRTIVFYHNYEALPDETKLDTALQHGNDVIYNNLEFDVGNSIYAQTGNWYPYNVNSRSTDLLAVPYGAISVECNFPLDMREGSVNCMVFLDKDYKPVGTTREYTYSTVPTGARYLVCQMVTGYDATADYWVKFKISNMSASTVKDELDEFTDATSDFYKIENKSIIPMPKALHGIGYMDCINIGYPIRYNSNSGWHYQRFDVSPGDVFDYDLNDNPIIMVTDSAEQAISKVNGSTLNGTLTIPNGASYVFVSIGVGATKYKFEKRNVVIPYTASYDTNYAVEDYLSGIIGLLSAASITSDMNPFHYYLAHSNMLSRVKGGDLKFAIFTDTHYVGTQSEYPRMVKALKRLQDAGAIDFAVCLGDGSEENKVYSDFTDVLSNAGVNYMALKGNHDLVKQSIIRNNCTNITGMVFDTVGCWAYLDDNTNGVRYIFLNACDKSTDVNNDTATITIAQGDFSYKQLNWLANTALITDKKVVLFNHAALMTVTTVTEGVKMSDTKPDYYTAGKIVQAFMEGTSGTIAYTNTWSDPNAQANVSYDFTSQGAGTAICLFNGHGHGDWDYINEYGLLSIMESNGLCINNMSATYGYMYPATANTITEIAFDVVHIDLTAEKIHMYRFGRGEDREFSYGDDD